MTGEEIWHIFRIPLVLILIWLMAYVIVSSKRKKGLKTTTAKASAATTPSPTQVWLRKRSNVWLWLGVFALLIGVYANTLRSARADSIRLQNYRERLTMENVWAKHPTEKWQTISVEVALFDSLPKDPRLLSVEDVGATVVALPDYSNGKMLEVDVHEVTYFREVRVSPSNHGNIGWVSPTIKRLIHGDDFNEIVDRRANAVQFFRYRTSFDHGAGTLQYREYYKPPQQYGQK